MRGLILALGLQWRGLILALGFLTRLPLPALRDFQPAELARAVVWFPVAGLAVGAAVALATALGARFDPWLGALAGVIVWTWITGGLHLDGLADMWMRSAPRTATLSAFSPCLQIRTLAASA